MDDAKFSRVIKKAIHAARDHNIEVEKKRRALQIEQRGAKGGKRQPRSFPGGRSIAGSGLISTPASIPLPSSVKQMSRCGRDKCRLSIDRSLLTYSGPYFTPHFMQITLTIPFAIPVWREIGQE